METMTIGNFIAALRKENGLTQQELADQLNVSNKAVSRWECGECLPDLTLIPALADLLGVTCDELLRGKRIPREESVRQETTDGASEQTQSAQSGIKALWEKVKSVAKGETSLKCERTIYRVVMIIALAVALIGFGKALCYAFALFGNENLNSSGWLDFTELFRLSQIGFFSMLPLEFFAALFCLSAWLRVRFVLKKGSLSDAEKSLVKKEFDLYLYCVSAVIVSFIALAIPFLVCDSYDIAESYWSTMFPAILCGAVLVSRIVYLFVQHRVGKTSLLCNGIQIGLVVIYAVLLLCAPFGHTKSVANGESVVGKYVIFGIAALFALASLIFGWITYGTKKATLLSVLRNSLFLVPTSVFAWVYTVTFEYRYDSIYWGTGNDWARIVTWNTDRIVIALYSLFLIWFVFELISVFVRKRKNA
ncbi:MAG: helix-turn-helix transcriptional regulator [Clostridia bacterium]|nr:helix-turn-helix transcriptional regulator [Clostridia bacterium]